MMRAGDGLARVRQAQVLRFSTLGAGIDVKYFQRAVNQSVGLLISCKRDFGADSRSF